MDTEQIAKKTGLSVTEVESVLEALSEQIVHELRTREKFDFLGLARFKVKHLAAREARTGINPFTNEEHEFAARPASTKVKILPTSVLKNHIVSS